MLTQKILATTLKKKRSQIAEYIDLFHICTQVIVHHQKMVIILSYLIHLHYMKSNFEIF